MMALFLVIFPVVAVVISLIHVGFLYSGVVNRDIGEFIHGLIGVSPLPLTIWAYICFGNDATNQGFGLIVIAVIVLFGSMALYD